MSSSLPFVPRKVARTNKAVSAASTSRKNTDTPASGTSAATVNVPSHDEPVSHTSTVNSKGKQKETDKSLPEEDYATLISLSLSDHALWSNPDLRMAIDSHPEQFTALSDVLSSSLYFAPSQTPPTSEPFLVKCIRTHLSEVFDVRMLISAPARGNWYKRDAGRMRDVGGGYEVRRRDMWKGRSKEGMTKDKWDELTVYLEHIPLRFRTIQGIARLVNALLNSTSVESVSLPGHHPDAKCKGFALVTLSSPDSVSALTMRWPWLRDLAAENPECEDDSGEAREARRFGLRCTSKRRWEEMGREYIAYRQRLLDTATEDSSEVRERQVDDYDYEEEEEVGPAAPAPDYPQNCLVLVRNIHASTNKTTLRALFSSAFEDKEGIDYVDYNKGMDTCYLRLKSRSHSERLIKHFTSHPTAQSNGLDGAGTAASGDRGDNNIGVELVTGTKEAVYWAKVPEKVRREAVARAAASGVSCGDVKGKSGVEDRGRKRRRV